MAFFKSLTDGVLGALGLITNAVVSVFNIIKEMFYALFSFLDGLFNKLVEFFTNILNGFFDICKKFFIDILNFFVELLGYLNPFSDKFFLKIALIPKDNYFTNKSTLLKDKFFEKFTFVNELKSYFDTFQRSGRSMRSANVPPKFTVNYMGQTFEVIDFSFYAKYRDYVHLMISALAWFAFLFRTYKKVPYMIHH